MLLLLAFLQQLEDVAGFGDSREVNLGLDLGLACFLFRRRHRLCRKVFPDLFSFIFFNGA